MRGHRGGNFRFSRAASLFRRQTGIGLREYTKRKRLLTAPALLKTTPLFIKQVAVELGYLLRQDNCLVKCQGQSLQNLTPNRIIASQQLGVHPNFGAPKV